MRGLFLCALFSPTVVVVLGTSLAVRRKSLPLAFLFRIATRQGRRPGPAGRFLGTTPTQVVDDPLVDRLDLVAHGRAPRQNAESDPIRVAWMLRGAYPRSLRTMRWLVKNILFDMVNYRVA